MTLSSCWVVSGGKYALDFVGGGTDRVEGISPISLAEFSQPFTWSAWIRIRSWRGIPASAPFNSTYSSIASIGTANFQTASFQLIDRKVQLLASSNGSSWTVGDPVNATGIGSTSLDLATWYHVAVTRNSAGIYTAWINGKSDGTRTLAANLQFNNSTLRIGSHYALNTDFDTDGQVDDMLLFDRALSATEMSNLYQSGRGGVYKQLRRTRLAKAASARRRRYSQLVGGGIV
jgi:hypothetical protein